MLAKNSLARQSLQAREEEVARRAEEEKAVEGGQ